MNTQLPIPVGGKKRGRPAGATDQVMASKTFGLDEYAAARAFVNGIDPLRAIRQYLLAEDVPNSSMVALRKIALILRRIGAMGEARRHGSNPEQHQVHLQSAQRLHEVSDHCLGEIKRYRIERVLLLKAAQKKLREVAEERNLKAVTRSTKLRKPDHFADQETFTAYYNQVKTHDVDLDAVELQAAYEDALSAWYESKGYYYAPQYEAHQFDENPKASKDLSSLEREYTSLPPGMVASALRALQMLDWTVQRRPHAADKLAAWIGGTTLLHLKNSDIFTLHALYDFMKQRGASWWRSVPGIGPVRARCVQNWMGEVGIEGLQLSAEAFAPLQKRRLAEVMRNIVLRPAPTRLVQLGLETLAPYANNADLNGSSGIFRAKTPNQFKADTDLDALVVALEKYKAPTRKVYAREMLRFFLWSYQVAKMPVSSLGVNEARLYGEFLADVPGHWVSGSRSPAPRGTGEWRPFRGQLDPASQRKSLTAINVILRQLADVGYVVGNPMAGVLKNAPLKTPKMNVSHALSDEQWRFACTVLEDELRAATLKAHTDERKHVEKLASLRRLHAMLHLLHSTGLRRDELFRARLGDCTPVTVDGSTSHLLNVTGKRGKEREVLIEPEVMTMVLRHIADRPSMYCDDLVSPGGRKKIPLISTLGRGLWTYERPTNSEIGPSIAPIEKAIRKSASEDGALGPDGMQLQIASFFGRCAKAAKAAGMDCEAFSAATLHWMRHSFAHSMVDAGVDLRVVQRAMGHANINTTAAYAKSDTEQMVRGIRRGRAAVKTLAAEVSLDLGGLLTPISGNLNNL